MARTVDDKGPMTTVINTYGTLRMGATLMTLAGIGTVAYAIVFFIRNFYGGHLELGITTAEVDRSPQEIREFSEDVFNYISHLHLNVAGLLAAFGITGSCLSWFGVRTRQRWTWWGAVVSTLVVALVTIPVHFVYGFASLAHVGPLFLGLFVFVVGAVLSYPSMPKP